ncbi:MAG: hypothetical protein HZB38_01235 [Planctomycetes bacterium]|nr:hypothetical protein [Planctomycetota bacterium]
MGPWTYYSPFAVGVLLVLALSGTLRASVPHLSDAAAYSYIAAIALGGGIVAQLLMLGIQGARAQVLPVPVGRSIRGRPAVTAGYLILNSALLSIVAFLLGNESLTTASWVLAILAAGSALGAVLIYIWSWPVAAPDFRDES